MRPLPARLLPVLLLLALPLLGCPKRAPDPERGDDILMDQYAARLEEVESRARLAQGCPRICHVARDGCELTRNICDVSARHVDRADMQRRCSGAQERCAHFNDTCAGCQAH